MPNLINRRSSSLEPLEARIAPATFTVINTNDMGAGSLRQAILDANGTDATDTIAFAASLIGQTITLTGGEIAITENTIIKGSAPGKDLVTISGNNASRIFNIDDSTPGLLNVSISGLAFVNGDAGAGDGGAIYTEESLTVDRTIFVNNEADDSGGAIYSNTSGKLIVKNSTFTGNTSTTRYGGAFYARTEGDVQVYNSVFNSNSATYGGAMCITITGENANLIIDKSTMNDNTATTHNGGAAHLQNLNTGSGKIIVKNSVVSGNSAGQEGGGFYLDAGNVIITKTVFTNNTAFDAGGAVGNFNTNSVIITSSTFIGNSVTSNAGEGGGALFLSGTAAQVAKVTSSTFHNNSSANFGGAISAEGGIVLTVTKSTFNGNQALAGAGGAIDNSSNGAGGGGIINVISSIFTGNKASTSGGAIHTHGLGTDKVDLNVTGSTFTGNIAVESGGAIDAGFFSGYINGEGSVIIKSSKFIANSVTNNKDGGALYLRANTGTNAIVSITGSLFSQNVAGNDGGGIALGGSAVKTITTSKIINNTAVSGSGGGVVDYGSGDLTITKSTISGNTAIVSPATYNGGGGLITLTGNKIFGNVES